MGDVMLNKQMDDAVVAWRNGNIMVDMGMSDLEVYQYRVGYIDQMSEGSNQFLCVSDAMADGYIDALNDMAMMAELDQIKF